MQLTKEEVIEKLKLEKSILADGGYGRSVRACCMARRLVTCLATWVCSW